MNKTAFLRILIAMMTVPVLVLCGHAQKSVEKKTSLLDDPMVRYPNEMYIAAVSSGDTPEAAKDRAISEVAMVIQADINLQQQLIEQYLETGVNFDMERKTEFNRQIEITTRQNLKNVNIGKTWLSDQDGRYYAVAYLDRMETSEIYQNELAGLDSEIKIYYDKTLASSEKLTRLAYINKAIELAVQRDVMANQLNTISLGDESFTPQVKPSELSDARRQITKDIKVKLDLNYGDWSELPGAVSEVLQSYGFNLADTNPDILVTGSLRMEQLERKGYFIRWFVDLHFKDLSTDTEFITYTEDDREGSTSFSEAERRGAMRMAGEVKKNLYQRLDSYFKSLMVSK
jgi:hypothetical protein